MIKAIIFDIGNVLLKFDYGIAFRALEPHCAPITRDLIASLEPLHKDFEAGRVGRSDFVDQVCRAIGYKGSEEAFIAAWEPIFEENIPMRELVAQLGPRMPLYLLSNAGEIHCDYILRTYPVFGAFADGVYSFRAGCLKPSLEIYQIATRQFGVNPAETLFLDDLPVNVVGAREAGFQAVVYDYNDHEGFLSQLRQLGVLSENG